MTDIDELRDRMATTPEAFGVRIAHDDLTALLDELAALRKAVVPVVDDEDRKLAQAVRDANARLHKGDDFDMELELAAQHIEAGRITTCDNFGYQIENDRLQAELAALRSAQQWQPLSQDYAENILLDCLKAMKVPGDDKCLIDEMRARDIWVYKKPATGADQ